MSEAHIEDFAQESLLRVLDRLDRYHGFTRVINAQERYDPRARDLLMAKINRGAARIVAEMRGLLEE